MNKPTIHNPTNFEPANYEVEDYLDNKRPEYCGGNVEAWAEEIRWWEKEMELALGPNWRAKSHRCVHCGNGSIRWITVVRYLPTDEKVVFGSDCTERLGFANKHAFKLAQLMARADARKIRFTIYNKRVKFLEANSGIADALANIDKPEHAKNHFVKDVLSKLDKWGTLSEAQTNAVIKSMARDLEYAAKRAAEATEPKGLAPTGRAEVSGEVLSLKESESAFGMSLKMLVKLDNNARVWVTAPSKETIERGDKITVRATWTPSKDDASFAFGSRPFLVKRTPATKEAA